MDSATDAGRDHGGRADDRLLCGVRDPGASVGFAVLRLPGGVAAAPGVSGDAAARKGELGMTIIKQGVRASCDGAKCEAETVGLNASDIVKAGWRVVPRPSGEPYAYCSFECEQSWIQERLTEQATLFDAAPVVEQSVEVKTELPEYAILPAR